jgi:hypothetical protein
MRLTLACEWLPPGALTVLANYLQRRITRALVCEVLVAVLAISVGCPFAIGEDCSGAGNPNHILPAGNRNADLQIDGIHCVVDGSALTHGKKGVYLYRNVNIYNGGTLTFKDAPVDFHAHSILVEVNSTLEAGATAPIKGPLTIWLWGTKTDNIASITCKSDGDNQCGIPKEVWTSNPNLPMKSMPMPNVPCKKASAFDYKLPIDDCFYQYGAIQAPPPESESSASKSFRHSGITAAFKTTFDVLTSVGPDNSLERLTERSVGLVTDGPSDVYELLVTLL